MADEKYRRYDGTELQKQKKTNNVGRQVPEDSEKLRQRGNRTHWSPKKSVRAKVSRWGSLTTLTTLGWCDLAKKDSNKQK